MADTLNLGVLGAHLTFGQGNGLVGAAVTNLYTSSPIRTTAMR